MAARDGHRAYLGASHMQYLFEFFKIVKIGGTHKPYACIEWPKIHIPQAILSLLDERDLMFTFYNNIRIA